MSEADLPEQFRIRQDKRDRLLAEGREPYPVTVPRTHTLAEIRAAYPELAPDTKPVTTWASPAGWCSPATRVLCFATLQDGDGTQHR